MKVYGQSRIKTPKLGHFQRVAPPRGSGVREPQNGLQEVTLARYGDATENPSPENKQLMNCGQKDADKSVRNGLRLDGRLCYKWRLWKIHYIQRSM